jgi:hypothetical protein
MEATEILRKHYGNHSRAAEALRLSPRHYRLIRRPGYEVSPSTALLIELMAEKIKREKSKKG